MGYGLSHLRFIRPGLWSQLHPSPDGTECKPDCAWRQTTWRPSAIWVAKQLDQMVCNPACVTTPWRRRTPPRRGAAPHRTNDARANRCRSERVAVAAEVNASQLAVSECKQDCGSARRRVETIGSARANPVAFRARESGRLRGRVAWCARHHAGRAGERLACGNGRGLEDAPI